MKPTPSAGSHRPASAAYRETVSQTSGEHQSMLESRMSLSFQTVVLVTAIGLCASSIVRAQTRIELHPIQTVTISTRQEFLLASQNGRPTTLAAELRIPSSAEKAPAVILVHGSGGVRASQLRWADEFNRIGVAAFLVDSFTGRGITGTADDQGQLDDAAMMIDAFKALGVLASHPQIDASRIAVMGFSKGAMAAVYSSMERFRKAYAPSGLRFAAHIGFYSACHVIYRGEEKVTGRPIRCSMGMRTIGRRSVSAANTSIACGKSVSTSLSRAMREHITDLTTSNSARSRNHGAAHRRRAIAV
jgi:predicted esterase